MKQSLTQLAEQGKSYEEAVDASIKPATKNIRAAKMPTWSASTSAKKGGSMTNDYQGRHNPASRPADRARLIYVAQLVATFLLFWSMS